MRTLRAVSYVSLQSYSNLLSIAKESTVRLFSSSRPIKSVMITSLFAVALAGIRAGRILRKKADEN